MLHNASNASNNDNAIRSYLQYWLASHSASSEIKSINEVQSTQDGTLYLATLKNKGFIVVQKVVSSITVVGFSFNHSFNLSDNNPLDNKIVTVNSTGKTLKKALAQDDVEPLTDALFSQNNGWNAFCPNDPASANGKTPVGCGGTALAIVMHYWKFPYHAQGSSSYKHQKYGALAVDFSKAIYNWDKMSSTVPDAYNTQLLYHCAIALKTRFDSTTSSTFNLECVTYALKQFFGYSKSLYAMEKSKTTPELWNALIKAEIKAGRPVIYTGYSKTGHDFIVDGCKGEYFHINWGWGGNSNGYFLLDNLIVADRNYSSSQMAIFGIEPQPVSKPEAFTAIAKTDRIDLAWRRSSEKSTFIYFPLSYDNADTRYIPYTPQRVTCFNTADFGFESPINIYAIGHTFNISTSSGDTDTLFNYTIYGSDGKSVKYTSDTISAPHNIEMIHTLSAPIQMSDTFYVGVIPLNAKDGYPASKATCVPVSQCRSFSGSAGNWEPFNDATPEGLGGREFHTYVYIQGKRSANSSQRGGYLIWRDGQIIDTIHTLATSAYTDRSVSSGTHSYKVAMYLDTVAYMSSFTDSIAVSYGANILSPEKYTASRHVIQYMKQGIELVVNNNEYVGFVVYAMNGKIIRNYPVAGYAAGKHFISFDNMNSGKCLFLPKGVYLLKIQIGSHEIFRKIVNH
jgi:hypothetical protein